MIVQLFLSFVPAIAMFTCLHEDCIVMCCDTECSDTEGQDCCAGFSCNPFQISVFGMPLTDQKKQDLLGVLKSENSLFKNYTEQLTSGHLTDCWQPPETV